MTEPFRLKTWGTTAIARTSRGELIGGARNNHNNFAIDINRSKGRLFPVPRPKVLRLLTNLSCAAGRLPVVKEYFAAKKHNLKLARRCHRGANTPSFREVPGSKSRLGDRLS
jgi:hypothetical protein